MEIREFNNEDLQDLYRLINEFQDYLVSIDDTNQLISFVDGGKEYSDLCLERIKKENGKIFVAIEKGNVVGFIAGVVSPFDRLDVINENKSTFGRIIELFITKNNRRNGIGKKLVERIEEYLKSKNCEVIELGVIAPNKDAYAVYKHLGYTDRAIDLRKIVR